MRALRDLDGQTRVVGVIGWPVAHSLSPPMQNAALEEMGLNWVYVPFAVRPEWVAEALAAVRALGLVGINVTVPHKETVAQLVDQLEGSARVLGSVNTVCNREGTLVGLSTDGEGFLRALQEAGGSVSGKRVVLYGAGGAGRAVAYAVANHGAAQLWIVNRTLQRAESLAALVREQCGIRVSALQLGTEEAQRVTRQAEVVINSTSQGMHPHEDEPPIVAEEWLSEEQWVCDLVYNPRETALLQAARRRNARTLDGTGMLVHQGALALESWTGREVPIATMRKALHAALRAREQSRGH